MNTLKAVLKHHNKEENVELSSEKVELGLIDDLRKSYSKVESDLNNADKERLKIIGARNKMAESLDKADDSIKKSRDVVKKYEEALKELGIEKEPNIVSNLKNELVKAEKRIKDDRSKFL